MRFAPTVIPPQATINGDIDTPGDVTVQGRVEGAIQAGETVTVIADATCIASIVALARGPTLPACRYASLSSTGNCARASSNVTCGF